MQGEASGGNASSSPLLVTACFEQLRFFRVVEGLYCVIAMMKKRYAIAVGVAAATAALLAHGIAEAKGGHSGGGHSGGGRSGGSHSAGRHSGGHSGGGHSQFRAHSRGGGFFVAAPLIGGGYSLYPYYPSYGVAPAEPVYYIEKTDGYWYYCTEAGRYYPDVEQCASSWMPVQGWVASPAP
jgi:hypothetical protein